MDYTEFTESFCDICKSFSSVFNHSECIKFAESFDKKKDDDNVKEIIQLILPITNKSEISGWHLDRLAASEFEQRTEKYDNTSAPDISKETKNIRNITVKIFDKENAYQRRRNEVLEAMNSRRTILLSEVNAAKEAIERVRSWKVASNVQESVLEVKASTSIEKEAIVE